MLGVDGGKADTYICWTINLNYLTYSRPVGGCLKQKGGQNLRTITEVVLTRTHTCTHIKWMRWTNERFFHFLLKDNEIFLHLFHDKIITTELKFTWKCRTTAGLAISLLKRSLNSGERMSCDNVS